MFKSMARNTLVLAILVGSSLVAAPYKSEFDGLSADQVRSIKKQQQHEGAQHLDYKKHSTKQTKEAKAKPAKQSKEVKSKKVKKQKGETRNRPTSRERRAAAKARRLAPAV